MAEALVSLVVEQLGSMLEQEVRLVAGVEKEVKKLKSNLIAIKAVLTDAETEQVQVKGGEEVKEWLWKLKDVAYDIGDVMEDWKVEILNSQTKPENKVCPFRSSCFCCERVCLRRDIASKIKELNESLDRIAKEKEYYHLAPKEGNPTIERPLTTSMIDIREVKGREEDKSVLINMLLNNGNRPDLHVVSIVGMGGIGKTTLAQFVYNEDRIKAYFDKKVWVCVSDPFDEKRVAETVLESLKGSMPVVKHLQGLLENIEESIKGKRFLLVLDNVWETSRKWEQLKQSLRFSSPGSKVLVTTRKENVAWAMGCSKDDILKVENLSDEECWLLVSKIAFSGRSNTECHYLEEIGKKISNKCRGLPLAAKALGAILRYRKTRGAAEYFR